MSNVGVELEGPGSGGFPVCTGPIPSARKSIKCRRRSAYGPGDPATGKPTFGEATCCALIVSGHAAVSPNPRRTLAAASDALKPLLRTAYRSLGWIGTDRTPAVAEDCCDGAAS